MDVCKCLKHYGPLMTLSDGRCSSDGCAESYIAIDCACCGEEHILPFAGRAQCFRKEGTCDTCNALVLRVLEPYREEVAS